MDPRDSNGGRVVCLHAHPTHEKPTLFVEVKLDDYAKKKLVNTDTIRRDVRKWLMDNFASLKVSQYLDISRSSLQRSYPSSLLHFFEIIRTHFFRIATMP